MKRWQMVVLLMALLLVVPLLTQNGTAQERGDVSAGKAVYTKYCASCHGPEGEGKPALAKMLKVELRHLGSKEVQAKSDEQLIKESVEGVGKMKPVKGLGDKDVANLLAFLRSLVKK